MQAATLTPEFRSHPSSVDPLACLAWGDAALSGEQHLCHHAHAVQDSDWQCIEEEVSVNG
jgi:hypothetical protein